MGRLDSGATCFAGPESSVGSLKDDGALVAIEGKTRPRFLCGSGKRERLSFEYPCSPVFSSKVFHAYAARPAPEESQVGSGFGYGLRRWQWLDCDGFAVCSQHQDPKPFPIACLIRRNALW